MLKIKSSPLIQHYVVPILPGNTAPINNTILLFNAASLLRCGSQFNFGTHILNAWKYAVKRVATVGCHQREEYVMRNLSEHALRDIGMNRILNTRSFQDV